MSDGSFPVPGRSRLGEVALWAVAGVLTLSVHAGGAYYLMQEPVEQEADSGPPAAIMIELAALPEAAQTEETVEADDVEDVQDVKSIVPETVDDVPPPEMPQPMPEPIAEETPPEPEPVPEPPQEVVEPMPEEPLEPVEEIDPIQEQQMAALENVEVPLPVLRPPPPPVAEKKKEEVEKKKVQRKPTAAPPASAEKTAARVETTQSDRTAAPKTSAGLFSSAVSPAKWNSRVRSAVSRRVSREGSKGMAVTVAFNVNGGGSIGGVRVLGSTGDATVDRKIAGSIEGISVPQPPPGSQTAFQVRIEIQ